MNTPSFLTDPVLCLGALLLWAVWAWIQWRPSGDDEAKAWMATLLRVLCGLLLFYASLDKLGAPAKFSEAVENYKVLDPALVPLAAVVLPWLEFFSGLCLLFGFRRRAAALLFCLLMALYGLSIGWDLSQDIDINCSCFSMDSSEKITWLSVVRDFLFLGWGIVVAACPRTHAALENFGQTKNKS
jgi:putative oxidoreductase